MYSDAIIPIAGASHEIGSGGQNYMMLTAYLRETGTLRWIGLGWVGYPKDPKLQEAPVDLLASSPACH